MARSSASILYCPELKSEITIKIKRLVCDRCGKELTDKYDIELALRGEAAWAAAARANGVEPRGIIPCENFVRCCGEMQLLER